MHLGLQRLLVLKQLGALARLGPQRPQLTLGALAAEHGLHHDGGRALAQEAGACAVHAEGGLDDDDGVQPPHVLEAVPRGAPAPHGLHLEDEAVRLLVRGAGSVATPVPLHAGMDMYDERCQLRTSSLT